MRTRFNVVAATLLALLAIALAREVRAQDDVTVVTQVKPPYSPYLSDYVGFDNKIVITLINKRNTSQSVRLTGQVKGNTGVTVTIPKTFVPAAAITLAPNQTKLLMGAQLKEYLNPDVLQFSGISKKEVVQGNGLPEGSYSLCIQALDYNSGAPKSLPSPNGCANFSISHIEPPTIMQPACNSTVAPKSPQNVLFTWTVPAGAPPAKVEYVLKIVEMFPANVNPNQAMAAATDPPFFEKVVTSTSFQFGPTAPKLEVGKKYAVRVTARNKGESKDLFFKNNGHSAVCSFRYGEQLAENGGKDTADNNNDDEDDGEQVDVEENYADPCTALNCAPQPPPTATPSNKTYQPGDEIKIGYFTLKLTSLSSASAGNLSGEGVIDAPVFRTKLKTTFQGLKVNPDNKVYAGKAIGAYDPGAQVDQALKNFTGKVEDLAADKVKALGDWVKNNGKYIEDFVDVDAQGLPFAWKKVIDGKFHLIDIASVEFAPDGARFNAFLEMPIPEAQNKVLAFGQKNICFHPTGLSVGGLQKLTMLGNDYQLPFGEKIKVTLKKSAGQNDGTFVKWDCQGYKEMQVDGDLTFDASLLEKAEGQGPVKATFKMNVATWGDMLGEITMDPFTVKGTKGLKLAFTKVMLDFSDKRNAQGMGFPANYDGGKGNDWRGLYFKQIKATLPKYLKKGKNPVEITLSDALISKLGFTGTATVQPVFAIGEGNLGGWQFSMEKLEIGFLNNSLTKGGFNGKLKLPIATTELGYSCLLSNSDQGLKTAFSVSNVGDINVDMWGAKLTLENGSSVSVESNNDDVTVKAVLNGSLTVDKQFADLKGVSVKIPGVTFEQFTIQNKKPYITAKLFKFASPQKYFAGFPVSIKPGDGIQLKFVEEENKAGLRLALHVGLDGNNQSAISGGTAFTLWGKMTEQNGKQTWAPAAPTLESIEIKASVASCDMEGKIDLYKGDEKFGDGFRGAIKVNFRPIVQLAATVQFGSTKYKSSDTYRYWYVDAMAIMGTGIPVFPGFGIYGFGGGAYHHMKPEAAMPAASQLAGDPEKTGSFKQDQAGATSSGVVYLPDPNLLFGFKASIVMGTMPKPNAFNGDVTLEASFNNGGGLNEISLAGNGYFMQPPDPKARPAKEKALVYAGVSFKFSNEKKTFDGLLEVKVNLKAGNKPILTGGGQASMHFSKNKWFIKLGEPMNRIKLSVLGMLDISSYLMVGKNSLPGMPQLPTSPINFRQKLPSFNDENPRNPQAETGSGFAFGQQLDINTGKLKFLIFYAQIAITFGYDISVLNLDQVCEEAEGGKMGINGWYAQGQVYAGLDASVGLDINLWFLKAQVELFQVGVYAALRAGLPNPTWLKGQVTGEYSALNGLLSGSCTFKFKYGDKCDPNAGDPFGGLKVIAEIKPSGSDVDVFSYPEVVYNLPIGKEISVQVVNKDDEVEVHRFRFGVKSVTVENEKTKKLVAGETELANKSMTTLFTPKEMFDEKTKYTVTAKIYGDKKVDGSWKRIGKKNNPDVEHLEVEEQSFTTGDAPEHFVNSNIIATRPGRMQRYYHYAAGPKGKIAFNQYPSNIPELKPKDPDYMFKYVARFQEIGAGSTVAGEFPIEWDAANKQVTFSMPNDLKKQKIYIVQIVRQKIAKKAVNAGSNVEEKVVTKTIGDRQSIKVKEQRLKAIQLGDNEFMVYQLAFKTSQYSRFQEKLQDYLIGGDEVTTGKGDYANTIYKTFIGKEPLDWYDVNATSYKKGSVTKWVEPNLSVEAVNRASQTGVSDGYYWTHLANEYYFYVLDPKLNEKLRLECTPECRTNESIFRTYPPVGAYGAGSRLTNGTSMAVDYFPKYAVGITYEGTGNDSKLTNEEINASYWKGYDPDSEGGPNKILGGGGGANKQVANQVKAPNTVDKMVIRYDVATVINYDRKQVYKDLVNWAGLNPSASSASGMFQGYLKFNSVKDWETGQQNPYYWDGKIKSSSKYEVRFNFNYGTFSTREVKIELP